MIEPRVSTPQPVPEYLLDLQYLGPVAAQRPPTPANGAVMRNIILAAISRAAERGETCPSNEVLGELTQLALATVAYHVRQLEAFRFIRIKRFQRSRVVVVTSSGRSTAPSRETLPHWRSRGSIQRQRKKG